MCEHNLNAGVATAENNQLCTLARSTRSQNRKWRPMESPTGAQESLVAAHLAVWKALCANMTPISACLVMEFVASQEMIGEIGEK